jgi:hypothetical protein
MIQLSPNDLLGKLKAIPANKEAESEWSDERTQSRQSKRPTMQTVDLGHPKKGILRQYFRNTY